MAVTAETYHKRRFIASRTTDVSAADTAKSVSTTAGDYPVRLIMATVKYSAAPTQAGVTVTIDSGAGAAYDAVISTGSANAQTTVYIPTNDLIIQPDDVITVTAPAAGGVITSAIAIYTESIRG